MVGRVVEGGCDRWLMGHTGILGLDGMRMLVGIATVVVATSIPRIEQAAFVEEVLQRSLKCFFF